MVALRTKICYARAIKTDGGTRYDIRRKAADAAPLPAACRRSSWPKYLRCRARRSASGKTATPRRTSTGSARSVLLRRDDRPISSGMSRRTPAGAEEARSRRHRESRCGRRCREHSEWAGYAVAILGAAMLLRALPGMILQMLLLGSNIAPGAANEWAGAVGAFVNVSAVPRGLRARYCRRAAAGPLAEKKKGST